MEMSRSLFLPVQKDHLLAGRKLAYLSTDKNLSTQDKLFYDCITVHETGENVALSQSFVKVPARNLLILLRITMIEPENFAPLFILY